MTVYPPIAPSTFRWFRLPTGHAPATLPCDAVEPPTTRQIGDSATFNRIVMGVWSVGYRKHRTLISGSSADDRSGSGQNLYERGGSDQMSAATPVIILPPTYQWRISLFSHGQVCPVCPVTFRSLSAITRMSSDEVQMKMSYQCPTSVLLLSDYLPVAPITLLLVTYQHYICVTKNVSDEYPTKLVGSEKSTFRSASGQPPASVEGGHKLDLHQFG